LVLPESHAARHGHLAPETHEVLVRHSHVPESAQSGHGVAEPRLIEVRHAHAEPHQALVVPKSRSAHEKNSVFFHFPKESAHGHEVLVPKDHGGKHEILVRKDHKHEEVLVRKDHLKRSRPSYVYRKKDGEHGHVYHRARKTI
jgi:hypothetical protein